MMTGAESSKFFELRAKTDRQLAVLIHNQLDAVLNLARVQCDPNWKADAEKIYSDVRRLLPVSQLSKAERYRLEGRIAQLRSLIDNLSSPAQLRMQQAC